MKRKGVTPVVATILMVTIAVAAGAVILSFMNSSIVTADAGPEVAKTIENLRIVQVKAGFDKTIHIYVLNRGGIDANVNVLYFKDYDGNIVAVIPVDHDVKVYEIADVIFDGAGYDVWNWYEVAGVTQRGNKIVSEVPGNPFLNDAIPGPGPNENEYVFRISEINVNGQVINDPDVLKNLYAIDGQSYSMPTREFAFIGYNNSGTATYFDLNGETLEGPKTGNLEFLQIFGDGKGVHAVTNKLPNSSLSCTIFNGKSQNPEYDRLFLNFSVDIQSGNFLVSITVQFWNWETGEYATAGNGYWQSLNMINNDYGGHYNFKIPFSSYQLISQTGDWSVMINITAATTGNINVDYDYFALIFGQPYTSGIETILSFDVSSHVDSISNVTKLIFSVTGVFPPDYYYFWFDAFNYSHANPAQKHWQSLGVINGNDNKQTWGVIVNGEACASFIGTDKKVMIRIFPVDDLPSGTVIQLEQAKLLVTVLEP